MNIEKIKFKFKEYVDNYNINDYHIENKLYHSYRVMELALMISKNNKFNEEDTDVIILAGLLHDYGRFYQWEKYHTFNDQKSIDHGDLAVKFLFDNNEIENYSLNQKYYNKIKKAIKYHNKYKLPNNLDNHNKLLCKVIRDADKIDIFYRLGTEKKLVSVDNSEINFKISESFFKNKQSNMAEMTTKNDRIVYLLSMIYDLNFKCSFKYLKDNNIIEKIEDNINNKICFKPYFNYIKKYIEDKNK